MNNPLKIITTFIEGALPNASLYEQIRVASAMAEIAATPVDKTNWKKHASALRALAKGQDQLWFNFRKGAS